MTVTFLKIVSNLGSMFARVFKSNKHISLLLIILIVVSIFSAGLVWQSQGDQGEKANITIGYVPIDALLDLFVAQEKGYFEEEGLKIKTVPLAGGAKMIPAVTSGDLDIVSSNALTIAKVNERGLDLKFIKGVTAERLATLLIRKDSNITQPADIKGKRAAVNTLGNLNELLLRSWAEKYNLNLDKVDLVSVPFPEMEKALVNNQVSVVTAPEPFSTLAIDIHDSAKPMPVDDSHNEIVDRLMYAGWAAESSWLEKNPEKTEKFLNAINKARDFIDREPEAARAILAHYTGINPNVADKVRLPQYFETGVDNLQPLLVSAYTYGFLDSKMNASEIIYDLNQFS